MYSAGIYEDQDGSLDGFPFVIWGNEQSHVLIADTEQVRATWITLAVSAANAIHRNFRIRSITPSSVARGCLTSHASSVDSVLSPVETTAYIDTDPLVVAPLFTPNSASSGCQHCGSAFMLLLRARHHCRCCGHLVCHDCSPFKLKLRDDAQFPERLCSHCFAKRPTAVKGLPPDLPVRRSIVSTETSSTELKCAEASGREVYPLIRDESSKNSSVCSVSNLPTCVPVSECQGTQACQFEISTIPGESSTSDLDTEDPSRFRD